MNITANDHPYRVTAVDDANMTANDHPIKVTIEGGVVTPAEFEELEKKVDALSTDLTYKGSVEDYAHLPSDASTGDVYTTEDTGVLYVWDGEEWVALNETKDEITILTTADNNYHYGGSTDNSIAPWLLNDGLYLVDGTTNTVTVASSTTGATFTIDGKSFLTVSSKGMGGTSYQYKIWELVAINPSNSGASRLTVGLQKRQNPSSAWGDCTDGRGLGSRQTDVLTANDIVNDLNASTNTSSYRVLAAGQGYALNQKIEGRVKANAGAPTTSTVGTVGMILEDTTTGDIYHCTAVSGNTYTWEKVGGSDNFRVLTTADYDYPTNNPNGVALWKLPNGVYVKENKDVKVYNNNATSGVTTASRMNNLMEGAQVIIVADDRYSQGYVHIRTFGDDGTYDTIIGAGSASTYSKVASTTGTFANVENDGKAITGRELGHVILSGAGAPTTSTRASTGCLYEDTTNGKLYICTNVSGSTYTWEEVGGINSISMADWNALFGQNIENVNGVGL